VDLRAELGSDPAEVARARHLVGESLQQWRVSDEVAEVTVLLVSELVTNAVRHARAPITLHLHTVGEVVRVEVVDGDAARIPVLQEPDLDRAGGRGLRLVDALSHSWGVDGADAGKCVWFEVARHAPVAPR
jgi:anti-sigma regulatory factor (Ser/Thr protein kinase)